MHRPFLLLTLALLCLALTACGALQRGEESRRTYQLLLPDTLPAEVPRVDKDLLVSRISARPGYETADIAYRMTDYEVQYFARSIWSERPARMIQPALVSWLELSGPFRHVVTRDAAVNTTYRLETELLRLEQDFREQPSVVRLALHVRLIDQEAGEVVLSRTLSHSEQTPSDDPSGGVRAANAALAALLSELPEILADALED